MDFVLEWRLESCFETIINLKGIMGTVQEFMESEGKSCSFDPEVIVVNCSWLMILCYD